MPICLIDKRMGQESSACARQPLGSLYPVSLWGMSPSPVFPGVVAQPMWALGIIACMVGEMQPLGCIGGCTVHEALEAVHRATGTHPLKHPHLQGCALVHAGAAFKVIQESQHLFIHLVDLTFHTVALAWHVQQPGDVVLTSNHQREGLNCAASALKHRGAMRRVQHDFVVGLASFQSAIHEDVGHLAADTFQIVF